MINIRKALPEDELFIISNRLDEFISEKDFFDIPNDILMQKKKEIEKSVKENYSSCKIVISDGELVGSFAVFEYEDGTMIDSIALKNECLNSEVKESVIKYVISSNYGYIYTIIYKNNYEEIKTYQRLGFEIVSEQANTFKLRLNNF